MNFDKYNCGGDFTVDPHHKR